MMDWSTAALKTASAGMETAGVLCMFAMFGFGFLAAILFVETERVRLGVAAVVLAVLSVLGMTAAWTAQVYVDALIEERVEVTP